MDVIFILLSSLWTKICCLNRRGQERTEEAARGSAGEVAAFYAVMANEYGQAIRGLVRRETSFYAPPRKGGGGGGGRTPPEVP